MAKRGIALAYRKMGKRVEQKPCKSDDNGYCMGPGPAFNYTYSQNFDLDASAVGFSTHNASLLAEASNLAFFFPDCVIKKQVKKWGFNKVSVIKNGGHKSYVMGNDTDIVVVYRGTATPIEMFDDIYFKPYNYPLGGTVQTGVYHNVYLALRGATGDTIKDFLDNNQRVWVTGHSLGGACALLSLLDMGVVKSHLAYCYTFGQIKVGNVDFVEIINPLIDDKYFRCIYYEDPIPAFPPFIDPEYSEEDFLNEKADIIKKNVHKLKIKDHKTVENLGNFMDKQLDDWMHDEDALKYVHAGTKYIKLEDDKAPQILPYEMPTEMSLHKIIYDMCKLFTNINDHCLKHYLDNITN